MKHPNKTYHMNLFQQIGWPNISSRTKSLNDSPGKTTKSFLQTFSSRLGDTIPECGDDNGEVPPKI